MLVTMAQATYNPRSFTVCFVQLINSCVASDAWASEGTAMPSSTKRSGSNGNSTTLPCQFCAISLLLMLMPSPASTMQYEV